MQVWLCPIRLDRCVLGLGAKWILNYPDILDKWPIKYRTNLSQSEIASLQLGGFFLEDGTLLDDSTSSPIEEVTIGQDLIIVKFECSLKSW